MSDTMLARTDVAGLIDPQWLADHLGTEDLQIVAIHGDYPDEGAMLVTIPGAAAFHWKELLWDKRKREFATITELKRRLAQAGIDPAAQMVFYGDRPEFGFYAHWAFLQAGWQSTGVLDGGLPAWRDLNFPLENLARLRTVEAVAATVRQASLRTPQERAVRIGRNEILGRLSDHKLAILDARSTQEFSSHRNGPPGCDRFGAQRQGRIPSATLFSHSALLDDAGRLRPSAELRAIAREASLNPARETVVYCSVGPRATLVFFVLNELLGFERVRVYDGSWAEWGNLMDAPIEH